MSNPISDLLEQERLLTTAETALFLGVSPQFLEANKRANGPKHIRVSPGCTRYRLTDIREWVAARTYQSTTEALLDGHKLMGKKRGVR